MRRSAMTADVIRASCDKIGDVLKNLETLIDNARESEVDDASDMVSDDLQYYAEWMSQLQATLAARNANA